MDDIITKRFDVIEHDIVFRKPHRHIYLGNADPLEG